MGHDTRDRRVPLVDHGAVGGQNILHHKHTPRLFDWTALVQVRQVFHVHLRALKQVFWIKASPCVSSCRDDRQNHENQLRYCDAIGCKSVFMKPSVLLSDTTTCAKDTLVTSTVTRSSFPGQFPWPERVGVGRLARDHAYSGCAGYRPGQPAGNQSKLHRSDEARCRSYPPRSCHAGTPSAPQSRISTAVGSCAADCAWATSSLPTQLRYACQRDGCAGGWNGGSRRYRCQAHFTGVPRVTRPYRDYEVSNFCVCL